MHAFHFVEVGQAPFGSGAGGAVTGRRRYLLFFMSKYSLTICAKMEVKNNKENKENKENIRRSGDTERVSKQGAEVHDPAIHHK